MSADDSRLSITKADSLLILLSGGTNYSTISADYRTDVSELHRRIDTIMSKASAKSYDTLKKYHQESYRAFFDRCQLSITSDDCNRKPMTQLVADYNATDTSIWITGFLKNSISIMVAIC